MVNREGEAVVGEDSHSHRSDGGDATKVCVAMRVDTGTAKHMCAQYYHFEQRTTEGADVSCGDAFSDSEASGIQVGVESLQQRQRRQTYSEPLRLSEERRQTSVFSNCI